nr:MAG TPA: minor structural protein [Caudoviricetes sp.]
MAETIETQNPQTPAAAPPTSPPTPAAPHNAANPQEVAEALMAALESRQKRAEAGVMKSMAEQYGMSDEEINQILTAEKLKRASQLPPEVQKQIEKANSLIVAAEIKSLGAQMGLLDPDAALLLMDRKGVKVEDSGAVTGAKEALESLKEAKPYLFGAGSGAWGERHGTASAAQDGVEEAFAKLNPNLKLN